MQNRRRGSHNRPHRPKQVGTEYYHADHPTKHNHPIHPSIRFRESYIRCVDPNGLNPAGTNHSPERNAPFHPRDISLQPPNTPPELSLARRFKAPRKLLRMPCSQYCSVHIHQRAVTLTAQRPTHFSEEDVPLGTRRVDEHH